MPENAIAQSVEGAIVEVSESRFYHSQPMDAA